MQLHIAAANGYLSVVEFLLDHNVRTDVRDKDDWQPSHAAACWGHVTPPPLAENFSLIQSFPGRSFRNAGASRRRSQREKQTRRNPGRYVLTHSDTSVKSKQNPQILFRYLRRPRNQGPHSRAKDRAGDQAAGRGQEESQAVAEQHQDAVGAEDLAAGQGTHGAQGRGGGGEVEAAGRE